MKLFLRMLGAVAAISLLSIPAAAQEKTNGAAKAKPAPITRRLCTQKDLSGKFVLVDFHEKPRSSITQWYKLFPYQYLAFLSEQHYEDLALQSEIKTADKLDSLLKSTEGGDIKKYVLDDQGVLDLYINKILNARYRCVITTVPADDFLKGDIILQGYIPTNASELYKLYRRWY